MKSVFYLITNMRFTLSIILNIVLIASGYSETLLRSCYIPRDGDIVRRDFMGFGNNYYKFSYDDVWDFSRLNFTGGQGVEKYRLIGDSIMICSNGRRQYHYNIKGDTTFLLKDVEPGQSLIFHRAEATMRYPMTIDNTLFSYFYSDGIVDGNRFMRQAGYSCTQAVAEGRLITPDNDSLKHVTLVHYSRFGTLKITNDTKASFQISRDSTLLNEAAISGWLQNDSITYSIDNYRWFAKGFRFPILETHKVTTYYYGTPMDSIRTALYYSPGAQEKDLAVDEINEMLRQSLKSEPWSSELHLSPIVEHESGGISTLNNVKCRMSPLITDNSTNICLSGTQITDEVSIQLYNMRGVMVFSDVYNAIDGDIYPLSLSFLPVGCYIASVGVAQQTFNFKLFKR